MGKYRKKPVVVEAWQMNDYINRYKDAPDWIKEAVYQGKIFFDVIENAWIIKTLEGNHTASLGDFIIQGVKGELYPCKPDIFELTYEKVV